LGWRVPAGRLIALLMAISMGAASCASVDYQDTTTSEVKPVQSKNYTLGKVQTAVVGDPIIRVKGYTETKVTGGAYTPDHAFSVGSAFIRIDGFTDQKYPARGVRDVRGGTYRVVEMPGPNNTSYGLQIDADGHISSKVLNFGPAGPVEMIYSFSVTPPDVRLLPTTSTSQSMAATDENFEIVFNGIDGQAMHMQYREYTSDNLARPAFSQELSYPLSTKTIRFRKLLLNVERISPNEITYIVVSDT